MRRLTCVALLAAAFAVPAFAQDSGGDKARRDGGQATEKAAKQKVKEGQDCDPNRAGVRCNKPKPKKVWFWGK